MMREGERREPPERHAHDRPGPGGETVDDPGHVGRVLLQWARSRSERRRRVGMPVTGQVDAQHGQSECERDRVPGVGVLGTPVEKDDAR